MHGQVTMAKEMMLTDVQTMTFTGAGIQVAETNILVDSIGFQKYKSAETENFLRKLQWPANQASHTMASLTIRSLVYIQANGLKP